MEISAGSKYLRRKESEVARAVIELCATIKYRKHRRPILGPQFSREKKLFTSQGYSIEKRVFKDEHRL
jgi:hypothetical protein